MWVVVVTTMLHICVNMCHEPEIQSSRLGPVVQQSCLCFISKQIKLKWQRTKSRSSFIISPTPSKVLEVVCSHVTLVHYVNPETFITVNVDSAPKWKSALLHFTICSCHYSLIGAVCVWHATTAVCEEVSELHTDKYWSHVLCVT